MDRVEKSGNVKRPDSISIGAGFTPKEIPETKLQTSTFFKNPVFFFFVLKNMSLLGH